MIAARSTSVRQPHLDGLRAVAVLFILAEHFNLGLPTLLRCGPLCVRFFFVLSGYFITLSLWKLQADMEQSGGTGMRHLAGYYFNRLLRIGPPFYLALGLGLIFGISQVRDHFFWLATFQINNCIARLGYWPDAISHFWSLAVQEQFYLLWPCVIWTLPRRWFLPAMAFCIALGLGFRLFCIVNHTGTLTRWVTLLGCCDSFSIGALIAYLKEAGWLGRMVRLPALVLFALPLAAFACFFLGRALTTLPENNVCLALTETVDGVFLAWLLTVALGDMRSRYGRLLSLKPLVYLGRISYGVYVYHVFIIILLSPLLASLGLSAGHFAFLRVGILLAFSLGLASLSWHWVEKPCLAWKNSLLASRELCRDTVAPFAWRDLLTYKKNRTATQ